MTYQLRINPPTATQPVCQLDLIDATNEPVGTAQGEFRRYTQWYDGQPYFFLDHIWIKQSTDRRQGLGSYLLRAVEAYARQRGARFIRGQFEFPAKSTLDQESEAIVAAFWTKNGYALKREVYDACLRVWKPLQRQPPSELLVAQRAHAVQKTP